MTKFGDRSNFKPSKISDVPPKQPFITRWVKLLESSALRSLSRYGHLMLNRFEVEHCRNAGKENGYLVVTYDQFVEWGIPRRFIKPTITELVNAKLLIIEHRGRGHGGRGDPSLYRLTYLKSKFVPAAGSPYFLEPTNDWEKLETGSPKSVKSNGARFTHSEPNKSVFLGSRVGNPVSSPVVNPKKRQNGRNP
jgi:hypothetical protein